MIRKQNEVLTSVLAMVVCEAAEAHWSLVMEEGVKEELEDTICFMLAAFGSGLRGEEVPLMSMEGFLTFWTVSREAEDRHVMLALKGRIKGEVDKRWHLVPVSDFTRLGLPFRLWMERALHHRVNLQNQPTGWVFQNRRGVRSKFGIYNHVFRDLVDRARELHFRLLPEVVETGDFSLWRSPRRGAVLETTNQDVAEKVIELINRWRKKEAARVPKRAFQCNKSTPKSRALCPPC